MTCRTSQNLQKASTFSTHSIHPFPIFPFDHPSSPYYKYYLLLLKARKYWALAHQNYTCTADYIISCKRKSPSFFCLLPRAFCSAATSLLCLLSELLEQVKKMLRDFLLDSISVHEVLRSLTLGCYKLK